MSSARFFGSLLFCAALGSAFVTAPALADSMSAKAAVAKYDQDNDKTLSLAEVKAAAATRFAGLDKDNDGTLDAKETKGLVGAASFKAADSDHDGTLSKDEYLALVQKRFERADVDHDGTLDARELSSRAGRRLLLLMG
jgi:hypothetical protein